MIIDPEFAGLLQYFKTEGFVRPPIEPPLIYTDISHQYRIVLATEPLRLTQREVILPAPFGEGEFPVDYSVIYHDHLVALFDPGHFACYHPKTLVRNSELERSLNTRTFQYHWTINDELIGLSDGHFYYQDAAQTWQPYHQPVPFDKRPKLYEDEKYLCFQDCRGEWGGTLFFFNKEDGQTRSMTAVCANSILRSDAGYRIVSSLGHMMGFAEITLLTSPDELAVWKVSGKPNPSSDWMKEPSTAEIPTELSWSGIQVYASFYHDGEPLYVVRWNMGTFLARIIGETIVVVDTLFKHDLEANDPVTSQYSNGYVLVNIDDYALGLGRETSCVLKNDSTLVQIHWSRLYVPHPAFITKRPGS